MDEPGFFNIVLWFIQTAFFITLIVCIILSAIALRRMSFLFMNHLHGETGSVVAAGTVASDKPGKPHLLRITNTSNTPVYKVILIAGSSFQTSAPQPKAYNREDNILPTKHIPSLLPGQSIDFPIGEIKPTNETVQDADSNEPFEVAALLDYLTKPNALKGSPAYVLLSTDHLKHAST